MEGIMAGGDELVDIDGNGINFRAKIESSFTKYTYDPAVKKWIACDKSGTQYHFGSTEASRMIDPERHLIR